MKPFNLEAAIRGEPLVTRDGRKAKFVAYVPEAEEGCRLLVFLEEFSSVLEYWDSGVWHRPYATDKDLFMVDYAGMVLAGIEFPEPLRDEPAIDQQVWIVDLMDGAPMILYWHGNDYQKNLLKQGLLQSTKEGAEQQLRAMIKSVGGSYD